MRIMRVENFVANEACKSDSKQSIPIEMPHTGKVIGEVVDSTEKDISKCVEVANKAYLESWSVLTVKARVAYLRKFLYLVESKYIDELADLIVLEHGKTKSEAIAEVNKGNETLDYACSMPQLIQGKILHVSREVKCYDERCPLGVVVSIVPFNFPYMVPFWTIGHILATGNTMVLKPSEKVPLTMYKVAEIWKEAGLPAGVFNIVNGTATAVNALCDHPLVKVVTFVGSSKVADIVSKRCRNMNKRVLALGGAKNHLVAEQDCNVEMASRDVLNSFSGCTGQRCMAASVLLTIGKRDDLLNSIVDAAKNITPGSGQGQMGSVIDKPSLDRINRYIDDAVQKYGAKIILDGRDTWWTSNLQSDQLSGYWIGPTIIQCKSPQDPAMTDEIFGPVLSVYECKDRAEAIAIENGCPYGNAACIYTESGKVSEWYLARFSAGMLGCNIGVPVPREPFSFGGINRSKFGDMDITGDSGIELFTYRKKVTTKWNKPAIQTWMD